MLELVFAPCSPIAGSANYFVNLGEFFVNQERSMLELVFAPCSPIAGGDVDWIAKKDEEIIDATMGAPRCSRDMSEIYRRDVAEICPRYIPPR